MATLIGDDKAVADRINAAEAAWLATLPACTAPSGHYPGFMGYCSHCEADVLFEDSDAYEALFPLYPGHPGCQPDCKGPNPCSDTCDI